MLAFFPVFFLRFHRGPARERYEYNGQGLYIHPYQNYFSKKQSYFDASKKVIDREFGAYAGIADNYPKYVISMDKLDFSREGIIHLNALTFLKDDLH